ncbi:MAG: hypothetical protein KAJ42_12675, partial [Gemmatimonadetes bacterium]|nr:hypothetical protein [Gemmatimonadota bacterium]
MTPLTRSYFPLTRTIALTALVALTACAGDGPTPSRVSGHENPLLAEWHTDFQVPPFDLIENDHYEPAFAEAMAMHKADIEAIVANPEAPSFENTIE